MSSPFDASRDSNTGGFSLDAQPDLPDSHAGAVGAAFDEQLPVDARSGETQDPSRFTYPSVRGPGGALAD
jgi:hypothetical protein